MSVPSFIGPRGTTSSPLDANDSWFGTGLSFVTNTTSFPNPNGTKYYYVPQGQIGNTLGYIYFDTSDNKWHDAGSNNPVDFRVGTVGSETPAESQLATGGSTAVSPTVSVGQNVIVYRNNPQRKLIEFTQPSEFYSSSGSGSGSGSGLQTLSGGSQPQIINYTYTRIGEKAIEVDFDYQNLGNINLHWILADGSTAVSTKQPSFYTTSPAPYPSSGHGQFTVTFANEGDIFWVEHPSSDLYTELPRYEVVLVKWTLDKQAGTLTAKGWFPDNGSTGFNTVFGSINDDVALYDPSSNPSIVDTAGKSTTMENSLSVQFKHDTVYSVVNLDMTQYGKSFTTHKAPLTKVFRNFW